jgi:glutathione peroxidase
MKTVHAVATFALLVALSPLSPVPQVSAVATASAAESCPAFLNQEYRKLHSSDSVNLCTLVAGKPMLIVNTASHCGFTPQFKGLEEAYQKYKARG